MSNSPIVKKRFATVDALEAAYSQQPNFQVIQLAPGRLNCKIYRITLKEGFFEFRSLDTPLRILGEKILKHYKELLRQRALKLGRRGER